MIHRGRLLVLPPNRVWRTYPGGATLNRIERRTPADDSPAAEDWIGSVTASTIPGREHLGEGLSSVPIDGQRHLLRDLLASDPEYFLGREHLARHGAHPLLLVKFLDPALRLNSQCHPSRDFARLHLGSPSGKTEAYHVLEVRPDVSHPYLYVGFQHPPTPPQLRQWIESQDVAAMEACFERLPLAVGDTVVIPGGRPHALGGGVFMVEIQEPTDFAIRYEFERAGYVLPEAARFMSRGIDFGLSMIDFSPLSRERFEAELRCRPSNRVALGADSWQETLIGPAQTPCFIVRQKRITAPVTVCENSFHIGIVTRGSCTVVTNGRQYALDRYARFVHPAGIGPVTYVPHGEATLLECLPPTEPTRVDVAPTAVA